MSIITICYEGIELGAGKTGKNSTSNWDHTMCINCFHTEYCIIFTTTCTTCLHWTFDEKVGKQLGAISRYKKTLSPWIAHPIPGPGVIKLFPCSTQLSMKFILLINVKMPTLVGISTFMSMISTTSERLKAINFFICRYFSFYE